MVIAIDSVTGREVEIKASIIYYDDIELLEDDIEEKVREGYEFMSDVTNEGIEVGTIRVGNQKGTLRLIAEFEE